MPLFARGRELDDRVEHELVDGPNGVERGHRVIGVTYF